jgi:hypothetical protein
MKFAVVGQRRVGAVRRPRHRALAGHISEMRTVGTIRYERNFAD